MYIECDKDACVGCLACVVACIDKHYPETCADAVSGRIYEKHKSTKSDLTRYVTRSCLHCQNPECVSVCPTGALFVEEKCDGQHSTDLSLNGSDDGKSSTTVRTNVHPWIVGLTQAKCIGCQACASACPHDMIRFDGDGHAMKCDGCADRIAQGLAPLCVKICPVNALRIHD